MMEAIHYDFKIVIAKGVEEQILNDVVEAFLDCDGSDDDNKASEDVPPRGINIHSRTLLPWLSVYCDSLSVRSVDSQPLDVLAHDDLCIFPNRRRRLLSNTSYCVPINGYMTVKSCSISAFTKIPSCK